MRRNHSTSPNLDGTVSITMKTEKRNSSSADHDHRVIGRLIRGRLEAQKIIFDTLVPIAEQRFLERDLKQLGQTIPDHVRGNL